MNTQKKNWFTLTLGFVICLCIRLFPFRPPNIEPILATQMPFARAYGPLTGFLFGFLSITFFDLITHTAGVWTLVTASAYGIIGFGSSYFFKKYKTKKYGYALFAVIATLFYDAITGLSISPLFFHQSFMVALTGQIPFTILHLLGNVSFAILFSPFIYEYIIENKNFQLIKKQLLIIPQKI